MATSNIFRGIKNILIGKVETREEAKRRLIRSGICLAITVVSAICFILGMKIYTKSGKQDDFFEYLLLAGYAIGFPAAIVAASPLGVIKALIGVFRFGLKITPFYLVDLIVGALLFAAAIPAVISFPGLIAAYGVYDAYKKYDTFDGICENYSDM